MYKLMTFHKTYVLQSIEWLSRIFFVWMLRLILFTWFIFINFTTYYFIINKKETYSRAKTYCFVVILIKSQ